MIASDEAPGVRAVVGTWLTVGVTRLTAWGGRGPTITPFYREVGGRQTIQRIFDHLQRRGATDMRVSRCDAADDAWMLSIRTIDVDVAREVVGPNVPTIPEP